MSEGNLDMSVQKEPFSLIPFEKTAVKIGQVTFNNFDDLKTSKQSVLVKDFLTKGLLAVYPSENLVGIENEVPEKKGLLVQELIRSMIGKVDAEKFKEEREQANQKLDSFDFSQPDQIIKFILHFGLIDPSSPMQKITAEIYNQLPLPVKQALAIKAF